MIARVQEHLEAIYGIECEQRAVEFLIGPETARALGGKGRSDEELLVLEEEDGSLEVALYVAPSVLNELAPYQEAEADGFLDQALDSFCNVTEGVSHFLYLSRAANQERTVSLFELELQGEIDKFASCLLRRWWAGEPWARELHFRIFDRISWVAGLESHEQWRYEEASRLSGSYCQSLIQHVVERRLDRLLRDLRYTYRLGAAAKLQHIARFS